MLLRPVVSTLLLSALWLAAVPVGASADPTTDGQATDGQATDGQATDVDGPLPRIGERGPVEGAPDGVSISPAVLEVSVTPGRRVEVTHLVANTTDGPLRLRIDTPTVDVAADGPVLPDGDDAARPLRADADARIVAPVDEVLVPAGEGVELRSTAEATAGSSGTFAVRATTAGGESVTALVVVSDGSVATGLRTTLHEATEDADGAAADGAAADLELAVDRHAVIDVRVRVRSWTGVLSDRTISDLVVGPDAPRRLAVDRPVGVPPGRMHVEVVAVDRDGQQARAELAVDLGLTLPVAALLVLVLAVLAVGLVLVRRRLRSGAPPPTTDEEPVR